METMMSNSRSVAGVVALLVVVLYLGGCLCQAKAEPPRAKEVTLDLGGGVTMEFVLIPAGEFMMGDARGDFDEIPVHKVTITRPFVLGKYEVTQDQWKAIMGSNPARFKGAKSPVERVCWNDCQAFFNKLNQEFGKPGVKFSLPTEAQWEYACRAGTSTRWNFGDDKASVDQYAWWDENSGNTTHPVGQKKPNAWGLYDMHGNVWEWCVDRYGEDYYKRSPQNDPTGPTKGSSRVLRGGCFRFENPKNFRCAFRYKDYPDRPNDHHGLRVARTLAP